MITKRCPRCGGTGIEDVVYHQDAKGNYEQEPIKCQWCDGFGRVDDIDSEFTHMENWQEAAGNG